MCTKYTEASYIAKATEDINMHFLTHIGHVLAKTNL